MRRPPHKANRHFIGTVEAAPTVDQPHVKPWGNGTFTQFMIDEKARRAKAPTPTFMGANPWSRTGWNLTEQMRLAKRDPITASRLQAEVEWGA